VLPAGNRANATATACGRVLASAQREHMTSGSEAEACEMTARRGATRAGGLVAAAEVSWCRRPVRPASAREVMPSLRGAGPRPFWRPAERAACLGRRLHSFCTRSGSHAVWEAGAVQGSREQAVRHKGLGAKHTWLRMWDADARTVCIACGW
jgi:hypothetical protein